MKTTSKEDRGLHFLPRINFCILHSGNSMLVSKGLLDMIFLVLFCGLPDSNADGLGFVFRCLSLWTREGTQVPTQDSVFHGKGRYRRLATQCLSYS